METFRKLLVLFALCSFIGCASSKSDKDAVDNPGSPFTGELNEERQNMNKGLKTVIDAKVGDKRKTDFSSESFQACLDGDKSSFHCSKYFGCKKDNDCKGAIGPCGGVESVVHSKYFTDADAYFKSQHDGMDYKCAKPKGKYQYFCKKKSCSYKVSSADMKKWQSNFDKFSKKFNTCTRRCFGKHSKASKARIQCLKGCEKAAR